MTIETKDAKKLSNYKNILEELAFTKKKLKETQETLNFYKEFENMKDMGDYNKIMLDSSPLGALIFDNNFQLHSCNKALAHTFDLNTAQEFLDNFFTLIPKFQPDGMNSLEKMQKVLAEALEFGEAKSPWTGINLKGEEIPSEVSVSKVKYKDSDMLVVYLTDLREISFNIEKTKQAESRMKLMFDESPILATFWNKEFQMIDCNKRITELFNLNNQKEFFEKFYELSPKFQPNGELSNELAITNMKKAFKYGFYEFEWLHQKLSGELIPTKIVMNRTTFNEEVVLLAFIIDLREQKAKEAALAHAKEAAEQSAKVKSEFLATMSHEIRTPMNGIIGLLHVLKETKLDELQKDFTNKILFSANELLRILNDILDFSKIEAGKLQMESTIFTIEQICQEMQVLFSENFKEKNIIFNMTENDFNKTLIIGDSLRFKQVLLNLIGNAIKFTSDGYINLNINKIKQNNTHITYQFEIKDTGIGISQKHIKELFVPFMQADSSITRKYGGTGLGLPICKSIVNMMGGEIWVKSEPHKGSSFFFTSTFEISNNLCEITSIVSPNNDTLEISKKSWNILVVEDNNINQLVVKELLKKIGHSIDIAQNGKIAIEMIQKNNYDAIIMDIQMPVMDGLEATKIIRANPKYKDLPIIGLSAHATNKDREKSMQYGMNEQITKPILPEVLYETLNSILCS